MPEAAAGLEDPRLRRRFREALLGWYARHRRDLPWRGTRNPYHVLVSEVMLQQTQVERVIPKYREFLARYPTLEALAAADPAEVRRVWYPLGYNRRPLYLHGIAREAVARYRGRLPADERALRRLKGIGRYTAGALLSFAYGRRAPVLDTNVRRVLGRVFHGADGRRVPAAALWALAGRLLPRRRVYDFNQALMDFGATWCTPRKPLCLPCPMRGFCRAFPWSDERRPRVTRPGRRVRERLSAARVRDDPAPGASAVTAAARLGAILRRVARCTACPTIRGYRQFPAGAAGRREARFMLVGEAPGLQSLERGRQWTGAGGMLLRREIRRLGLDLEDLFYLTNAVKCWPAAPGGSGNRAPLASEVARCAPFLRAEVAALDPAVIVAVGAVAARALADRPVRLPEDHGRRFHVAGRELVVLLHPANASRHRAIWPTYRASVLALFAELASRAGFPVVEVAAAVICREGRYLITRRGAGQHLAGLWEFPGGKRDPGESLEACLARELEEELGLRPRVGERLLLVPWTYPDRRVVLHFFACEIGQQAVEPREGQAYRWAAPDELVELAFPPADRALVDYLRRGGRPGGPGP